MLFTSGVHQVLRFELFKKSKLLFIASFLCLFFYCSDLPDESGGRFTFSVADVGQGLAQFGVYGGRAVVWDMGPGSQYSAWYSAYEKLGKPIIELIVISHTDEDHRGGLSRLHNNINWNGTVAVSPFEDTAKIRASAGVWSESIKFHFYSRGDSIKLFNSVDIICLWPPKDIPIEGALDGVMRNRFSLVFSVAHGYSRGLITSDIDSIAMSSIAAHSGYDLRAQLLVVPHHASKGSVNTLFFSYVSPQSAIISCSATNNYGHPSHQMIGELLDRGASMFFTYIDGTLTFESNGHYWSMR
jgi:competence protein ComEC